MKSLVLVTVLSLSASAFAQGVKVKKALDYSNSKVAEGVAAAKTTCGVEIKATLKGFETSEETANAGAWCNATLSAIATLCKDADYKDAIAKSVKSVTCTYDKALTKDTNYGNKFELKSGSLTHSYNEKSFNAEDKTSEFLKANL